MSDGTKKAAIALDRLIRDTDASKGALRVLFTGIEPTAESHGEYFKTLASDLQLMTYIVNEFVNLTSK